MLLLIYVSKCLESDGITSHSHILVALDAVAMTPSLQITWTNSQNNDAWRTKVFCPDANAPDAKATMEKSMAPRDGDTPLATVCCSDATAPKRRRGWVHRWLITTIRDFDYSTWHQDNRPWHKGKTKWKQRISVPDCSTKSRYWWMRGLELQATDEHTILQEFPGPAQGWH